MYNKKKKIKHHIDVNETRLKFRFTVKKNGRLEELINNFMKENSEYKFGDSQLLRKKNKKTKRWDYWFMLAYSCPKKDPGKKTKDHSGISGHGFICFRSGMVSDEESTCLSII